MTAAKLDPTDLPAWPRLLDRELAAAYLSISPNVLDRVPVPSIAIGRRRLYDRVRLDAFVDGITTGAVPDPNRLLEMLDAAENARAKR